MSILQKSAKMRKAFTLMEMVVSLGILAIVMSFAGTIFRVGIDSHRLALANAEIMQKLRAITEQLDLDFRGLRKEGEILVFWRAQRKASYTGPNRNAEEAFDRFDRIMFFADGDFQTYRANPTVRGSMARICYALANGPSANPAEPNRPQMQKPERRVLARTEHILVAPPATANPDDPLGTGKFTDDQWRNWMSNTEYDAISMRGWELIPLAMKVDILSVIGDVEVGLGGQITSKKDVTAGGVTLDPAKPESLHSFMCRGVGQFEVQGWSDAEQRWIPQVNPDGDADLKDDSDFVLEGDDLHPRQIPGLWYPRGPAVLGTRQTSTLDADFNKIPGLGRALKFTFTLYDSRGLIKSGRTFTHIVYLDD
jgi:prepilin-type N-terminal cleavage/methylation domain-containing protein